jgi:nickel-type superoxide dismutase maturation protease
MTETIPVASRTTRYGAVAILVVGPLLWWWSRCATRVVVEGPSMLPTLAPADRLLVVRRVSHARQALRVGDLVVMRDPERHDRLLVKRVTATAVSGVVVVGDNPGASRDSRHFGEVSARLVVGRAWYRYAPATSAGRLDRGRTGRLRSGATGRRSTCMLR